MIRGRSQYAPAVRAKPELEPLAEQMVEPGYYIIEGHHVRRAGGHGSSCRWLIDAEEGSPPRKTRVGQPHNLKDARSIIRRRVGKD